jgi:AmmeMemoRadiSam system protein B
LPQVVVSDAAHALEHSLEVQLPFLQTVLDEFTLLPLAVGRASAAEVAEVLECLWGGDETLIVISSDLSHYLPYALPARPTATPRATSSHSMRTSTISRPAARHRSMACCWPRAGTDCRPD